MASSKNFFYVVSVVPPLFFIFAIMIKRNKYYAILYLDLLIPFNLRIMHREENGNLSNFTNFSLTFLGDESFHKFRRRYKKLVIAIFRPASCYFPLQLKHSTVDCWRSFEKVG